MDSSNTKPPIPPRILKLKKIASELPVSPGVYIMLDTDQVVIYVGKAKRLRHRVLSYFSKSGLSVKTQALMQQVEAIDVALTATETEALLLEANLIKQHRPRYNVVLRDDKSYPYLSLGLKHDFPRLVLHRGAQKKGACYFGPYPSVTAVRETLNLIQKIFKIRNCSDSDFSNRDRPCLQYQINRCTAPCVDYVSQADYAQQVALLKLFLVGRNEDVIAQLTKSMRKAAKDKNYEGAAQFRDKIADIRQLQQDQSVTTQAGNIDIIGGIVKSGVAVVSVLFVRGGRVLGQRYFYPKIQSHFEVGYILSGFMMQYYLNPIHQEAALTRIVVINKIEEPAALEMALSELLNRKLSLINRSHAKYRAWGEMLERNLAHQLHKKMNEKASYAAKWQSLCEIILLKESAGQVACFDISHTQGQATVASCVVFDEQGKRSDLYRRFNINNITPGDDYAAMRQAVQRHFSRLLKQSMALPDVLLIDGGKGQLSQAAQVMSNLNVSSVILVGVAKGEGRKAGKETLHFICGRAPLQLAEDSLGFHLIQHVRDEAHRFAITAHRSKRSVQSIRSVLESIPGVGGKRRQALLVHFGGFQGLKRAGISDIAKVAGVSSALAEKIYRHLHDQA